MGFFYRVGPIGSGPCFKHHAKRTTMKKLDPRLRKAIISKFTEIKFSNPDGMDDFIFHFIGDASFLINALTDRALTGGLTGSQKNYAICEKIAALQIRLEQAKMIWSTDNIESIDFQMMKQIENDVREWRNENIPPRSEWPRCKKCGGLVDVRKSHDVSPVPFTSGQYKTFTCHKCVD